MPSRLLLTLPLALLVVLTSAPARAQETPPDPPDPPPSENAEPESTAPRHHRGHVPEGWFLPVGVNIGGAVHPSADLGYLFGVEGSLVYFPLPHATWGGGYVDAVYDTGTKHARFSVGPEFGFTFIGLDGGLVVQPGTERTAIGFQGRVLLTLGVVSVYARWGKLPALDVDATFREIGILLKFPILLRDDG
jgi:hypothetical protein